MDIYLLTCGRHPERFADFAVVGTWKAGRYCETCTYPHSHIVSPLTVEWEPGSNQIADVHWDSCYTFVVTDRVRRLLVGSGLKLKYGTVKHVRNSERIGKRTPHVKIPYRGPTLYWPTPQALVPLNEKLSRVRIEESCPDCGWVSKTFKSRGIVIDRQDFGGQHVFRIVQNEPSGATFVTEKGKRILEKLTLQNLGFARAGRIGPATRTAKRSAGR